MKVRILKALLRKEFLMLKRNPFIPRIIVILPLMVMLVIPLVTNMDVRHVGIAVVDNDHSILSRRIASDIDASEYLTVIASPSTYDRALRLVEEGKADVVINIPADYARNIVLGNKPQIDLAANGVNSTKGSIGGGYAATQIGEPLRQWAREKGITVPAQTLAERTANVSVDYKYNPTLDFRNFMIPALIVMLIIIICGFLPTLNLVGEKESGSIEAMNVTPVGKMTFVLSKLIPYWICGMIVVSIGMLIGWWVYGLMPMGNIGAVYLAAILFTLVMSGLGLIIANNSSTILQSILLMLAIIMVFQLMAGLFTPISSMPGWAQIITYGIPPRYFIEIIRAIYLKGASIADLWFQFSVLGAMAVAIFAFAAITYRKQS